MDAIVLSIGSELLRGDIVDTNAAFLTRQLSQLGFRVRGVQQVGDDLTALTAAVRSAIGSVTVTVSTGGLGPTQDDLTRQAIAAALNEELFEEPGLVRELEERFASMGRRMPDRNRQQALLIPSAEAVSNPHGTAPGWYVVHEEHIIAAMPGPPSEMQPMWEDGILPRLQSLLPEKPAMLSLMTFGLGESAVEERIDDVIRWRPDVTVATYAKSAGVEVHLTAYGSTSKEAESLLRDAEERVRARLGDAIFGHGGSTLSAVVGHLLDTHHLNLAVMESCTGGLLASMLTDTDGSSSYFLGGIVAYSAQTKRQYGVAAKTLDTYGLISAETAQGMARAACQAMSADYGLGTTGIAGNEPVEGKPPGTVYVALHGPDLAEVREIHRPGSRPVVKHFASLCALDLLRRSVQRIERQNS